MDCASGQGFLWSSSRSYTSVGSADKAGILHTSNGGCTPDGTGFRSEFPCYMSGNDCRKNWYHVPFEGDSSVKPFFGNCAGGHPPAALYRLTFQNTGHGSKHDIDHIYS